MRIVRALFALLALSSPAFAAAVVTTKFALNNAGWTDLGAGPVLLSFNGPGVYAIGDATPALPLGEGFTIRTGKSARVKTASHVWAMAAGTAGVGAYAATIPASGGGCAQSTAYLARTAGGNEGGNAANVTTLICALVTDGVIDGPLTGATGCGTKLDALYLLAQQTASDALLNLCGTSYSLTSNGTFASLKGYSGFTTGMTTGFNPAAGSPKYVQNSASLGVWSYAVVSESAGQMGNPTGDSGMYDSFSGSFYPRVNGSGTPAVGATPGAKGLFVGDRNVSVSVDGYWNGIDQGTVSGASTPVSAGVFFIGCGGSPSGCTTQTLSEAHIGASLGAAGNLTLYNRLRTYMTAVGVP